MPTSLELVNELRNGLTEALNYQEEHNKNYQDANMRIVLCASMLSIVSPEEALEYFPGKDDNRFPEDPNHELVRLDPTKFSTFLRMAFQLFIKDVRSGNEAIEPFVLPNAYVMVKLCRALDIITDEEHDEILATLEREGSGENVRLDGCPTLTSGLDLVNEMRRHLVGDIHEIATNFDNMGNDEQTAALAVMMDMFVGAACLGVISSEEMEECKANLYEAVQNPDDGVIILEDLTTPTRPYQARPFGEALVSMQITLQEGLNASFNAGKHAGVYERQEMREMDRAVVWFAQRMALISREQADELEDMLAEHASNPAATSKVNIVPHELYACEMPYDGEGEDDNS